MTDVGQNPETDASLAVSCQDEYDPESISVAEAAKRIDAAISAITESESVNLRAALGRILSDDIHAQHDVPGQANSAMDGYAITSLDIPESGQSELKRVGSSYAGVPWSGRLLRGSCVRITTGGVLPAGADTIVIQEQVRVSGKSVFIGAGHTVGQNVRAAGEDLAAGETALTRGTRLTPSHLGLLASIGVDQLRVFRKCKCVFFSTGDELCPLGGTQIPGPGQLYDSNRYSLFGMLKKLDCESHDLGIVKDSKAELRKKFCEAMELAPDAIICSGGVSVGDADYTRSVIAELGKLDFWKVAVKPGRPFTFGSIDKTLCFGLPGNPVSVVVTFCILVKPALNKKMGNGEWEPLRLQAHCTSRLRKRKGRMEYQRGILETKPDGGFLVHKSGAQGSGILSSLSSANCLIELDVDLDGVAAGQAVEVLLFPDLLQ